jgi:hypothetical protein
MSDDAPQSCHRRLFRLITLDIFNPATTLLLFLRKMVLLNGMAVACIASTFFFRRVADLALGRAAVSAGAVAALISTIFIFSTSAGTYFYAMRTFAVPNWALALQLWGNMCGALLIILSNPTFPAVPPFASYCIFASICAMPYDKLFFFVATLLYLMGSFNYAAMLTGGAPIALDGYEKPVFMSIMVNCVAGLVMLAFPVIGCIMQRRQHHQMLVAATAAAEMSINAAQLLGDYDTDGVLRLLDEYRALDDADPALIEGYETLVVNLNQYRPHLPNWMIKQERGDDEQSSGRTASTRHSKTASQSQSLSGSLHSSQSQLSKSTDLPSARLNMSREEPHAPTSQLSTMPSKVNVAFATAEFVVEDGAGVDRAGMVNRFVDITHALATTTHCALHSLVGDTVQLSWNAAVRVAQPGMKAVRFLCRLKDAMKSAHGVSIAAAAMCGKATTQFAGTGRVQALTVALPWRRAHQALMRLACHHRVYLIPGATAASSTAICETRAVDVVRFPSTENVGNNDSHNVVVHEVIKERDDDDDEWMYVLEKKALDPVTAALHLCVEKRYAEAIAAIDRLVEANGETPDVMVMRLRERAEQALLRSPDTFSNFVPTLCSA